MVKASAALEALVFLMASTAGAASYPSSPGTFGGGGVYRDGVFIAGPTYIDPVLGGWFYDDIGMGSYSPASDSLGSDNPGWGLLSGGNATGGEGNPPNQAVGGSENLTGNTQSGPSQPGGGYLGSSGAGSGGQFGSGNPGDHAWPGRTDNDPASGARVNGNGAGLDIEDIFVAGSNNTVNPFAIVQLDSPAAVPEPGTLTLLSVGLAALGMQRRRRRFATELCGIM